MTSVLAAALTDSTREESCVALETDAAAAAYVIEIVLGTREHVGRAAGDRQVSRSLERLNAASLSSHGKLRSTEEQPELGQPSSHVRLLVGEGCSAGAGPLLLEHRERATETDRPF